MADALPVIVDEPVARGFGADVMAQALPDPWGGHFSHMQRKRVRAAIGLTAEAVLITASLDQLLDDDASSERDVMERLVTMSFVYVVLHGSVWTLRSPWFRQIAKRYGNRLIYAGASHKVYDDIRLIAATDLLFDEAATTVSSAGDARLMRTMALGPAFDGEVKRVLLDYADMSYETPDVASKLIRDELDRLANECLNRAKSAQRGRENALRSCQQRKPNRGTSP